MIPVLPVDHQARDVARGVTPESRRGRLLVEAAAGSGKTSVLVDRVLSYLLAGERTLSEMVVVTFTEAAAAELRLRLRQGLAAELTKATSAANLAPGSVALVGRLRAGLADLEAAAAYFDEQGISHGGIKDLGRLGIYVMAVRDPDNIQLELTAPHNA